MGISRCKYNDNTGYLEVEIFNRKTRCWNMGIINIFLWYSKLKAIPLFYGGL